MLGDEKSLRRLGAVQLVHLLPTRFLVTARAPAVGCGVSRQLSSSLGRSGAGDVEADVAPAKVASAKLSETLKVEEQKRPRAPETKPGGACLCDSKVTGSTHEGGNMHSSTLPRPPKDPSAKRPPSCKMGS